MVVQFAEVAESRFRRQDAPSLDAAPAEAYKHHLREGLVVGMAETLSPRDTSY
jgi:hypothetical protein